jgi:sarcosine oxidase subunit gamma
MLEPMTADWSPRGAWAGLVADGRIGAGGAPGVSALIREGLGIATLIGAEGGAVALAQAVRQQLGLDLPATSAVARAGEHALAWAGPDQWLLVADRRGGFAEILTALSGVAAVSDQSDDRAVLRLAGPKIRETLAKGCMIDLHPAAFPVGATALTSIAHIGIQLWRAQDEPDDADGPDGVVFEIMIPRSMAGSFWSWFAASVAEFGCQVLTENASSGRG